MIRAKNIKNKRGFTIIEVVLVLAIAGLIFLMVFIAPPSLQRSQRDTQRRSDMARFMSQIAQYQANNGGKVPADKAGWGSFPNNYLKNTSEGFADPDGTDYQVGYYCKLSSASACAVTGFSTGTTQVLPNSTAMTWTDGYRNKIYVYTNARCDGEKITYVKDSPNQVAIRYKLEGAGIYCANN